MSDSRFGKSGLRKSGMTVSYKQEIFGVLGTAIFLFFALSFLSYCPTDNSWFYFASANKSVANWCGTFGAHVAALCFFLFGSACYVLLVAFVVYLVLLFQTISFREAWTRLLCVPVVVFACAALLNIHEIDFVNQEPGGLVGRLLHTLFVGAVGRTGALIFLYALVWLGILVVARISVLGVLTFVASRAWAGFLYGARHFLHFTWVALRLTGVGLYQFIFNVHAKKNMPTQQQESGSQVCEELLSLVNSGDASKMSGATPISFDPKDWAKSAQLVDPHASLPPEAARVELEKMYKARDCGGRIPSLGRKQFYLMRNTVLPKKFFDGAPSKFLMIKNMILTLSVHVGATVAHELPIEVAYKLPDFTQLQEVRSKKVNKESLEHALRERGKRLEEKLEHFDVRGKVVAIRPGPVITLFEYKPEIDSKISKIIALEDDLALALTALSIRIVAPIPGRNVVGFEISNQNREDVFLSEVLEPQVLSNGMGTLPLALGVDITGNPVIQDLLSMPHVLVAGSTGSGKSVGLNAMLVSLLCALTPEQLRIILIDPKRLEFAPYADIPHLLFPIVTNPRGAVPVLKWVVQEMEDRYDIMARSGARSVGEYHELYQAQKKAGGTELPAMPFIVVIIDELADLMMVAGKDVEMYIARTAQMARAAGIHMIVATQRPSVDVLTGVIKVNFPARIAFRVSSKIDSRTILDASGAEKLLGRGDMLFMNSSSSSVQRIHGAYVSSQEIVRLAQFLKQQAPVNYLNLQEELRVVPMGGAEEFEDELYDEVRKLLETVDELSISLLQRRYRIGFNRSARIIEKLEMDGLIAPAQGGKTRKVLR